RLRRRRHDTEGARARRERGAEEAASRARSRDQPRPGAAALELDLLRLTHRRCRQSPARHSRRPHCVGEQQSFARNPPPPLLASTWAVLGDRRFFFRSERSTGAMDMSETIFFVDDDACVRDSLEQLAGSAGWRMETFASASEFLARPRSLSPSCLVLDVGLPDASGLEMQRRLADRPETPIIFVTGCRDVRTAARALKAGPVEFFTKPLPDELLLH